jgi:DNA-binding NtrC family response regulator
MMKTKPILIVDDEKNIRLTLSQALEALDIETQAAVNGEEALGMLEENSYSLILLDLKMPGMDGIDVLRRVRDRHPEIKVIIITAHGSIDSATEAMKLGAVDFIQKPFAPKEIRELITNMLKRDTLDENTAESYKDYLELAKKGINEKMFDSATRDLRQAIAIDSTKPEAFNLLGALKEMDGDWLDALKQYRAAIALDPTYKPANENVNRIVTLHQRGTNIDLGDTKASNKDSK